MILSNKYFFLKAESIFSGSKAKLPSYFFYLFIYFVCACI